MGLVKQPTCQRNQSEAIVVVKILVANCVKCFCLPRRTKHLIQIITEQKSHIIANGNCKPLVFLKFCFGMTWVLYTYAQITVILGIPALARIVIHLI